MLMLPPTFTPEQIERDRLWAAHWIARSHRVVEPALLHDTELLREAVRLLHGRTNGAVVSSLRLIFGQDRADVTKKQVAILRAIAPEAARAAGCCVVERPGRRFEIVPPVIWSETFAAVIRYLWERRQAEQTTLPRIVADARMWAIVRPALGYLHETEIAETLEAEGYGEDLLIEVSRLVLRLESIHFIERPACLTVPNRRRYQGTSPHRRRHTIRQHAAALSAQCWEILGAPLTPRAHAEVALRGARYLTEPLSAPAESLAHRIRLAAFAADAYRPVLTPAERH